MYRRIKPCRRLLPFVESFWIQERSEPPFDCDRITRVLPTGSMDLVFYHGDPFSRVRDGRREILPRAEIAGQRSGPVDVCASGRTGIVIASLKPWGGSAFLPGSMTAFADRSTDLEDVLEPSSVRRLVERLSAARTGEERARRVESFLLESVEDARRDELVVAAANRLRSFARISALGREDGLSVRQWTRRFEAHVGLAPKKFARVMRFQRAAALKKNGLDWGEICRVCGYCDQSHLIKEFQSFAGRTFEGFRTGDTPLTRSFNRRRGVSHFYNTIYLSLLDAPRADGSSTRGRTA